MQAVQIVQVMVRVSVGAIMLSACGSQSGIRPTVVTGYTTAVNVDGTAIGLSNERGGAGEGYVIAGATWRDQGGPWQEWQQGPTCAEPLTSGQQLRLGVVHVAPESDALGRPVVAWFECLD